jgi:Ribbon-helix-helix protein, copG family
MQVQFSEEQVRVLKARAARERVSISEIVRRAVNAWAKSPGEVSDEERRRRAIQVAGHFASGLHDVAARHDDYLVDAYRS